MSKVVLSICKNYVKDWGLWEGVREIVQNALDENDKGNCIYANHSGKKLTIGNKVSNLSVKSLLIGYTTKGQDRKSRGEKGEGLDLGLLALVRDGYKVEVRTHEEDWTPFIEYSDLWGEEVLCIDVKKTSAERSCTEISIGGITEEKWNELKFGFLDFHDVEEGREFKVDYHGSVLFDAEYRGKIYVKGIWVQDIVGLRYGYNLLNVSLDRDRRMVESYNLGYHLINIWNEVLVRRDDFKEEVWDMLNKEIKDVQGFSDFSFSASQNTKNIIAEMFLEKNGENVIPVESTVQMKEMEHIGKSGCIVPKAMMKIICDKIDNPIVIKEKMKNSFVKEYKLSDLSSDEYSRFTSVILNVQNILNYIKRGGESNFFLESSIWDTFNADISLINITNIVDFREENLRSFFDKDRGKILISRGCLDSEIMILRHFLNGVSFMISNVSDCACYGDSRVTLLSDLWSALYYNK